MRCPKGLRSMESNDNPGEKNTLKILILLRFLKTNVTILSFFIFLLILELEACK